MSIFSFVCFFLNSNSLPHNYRLLTTLRKEPFENTVGKGENAGFYLSKREFVFKVTLILPSANAFKLDQSKILSFVKGLILYYMNMITVFNESEEESN